MKLSQVLLSQLQEREKNCIPLSSQPELVDKFFISLLLLRGGETIPFCLASVGSMTPIWSQRLDQQLPGHSPGHWVTDLPLGDLSALQTAASWRDNRARLKRASSGAASSRAVAAWS